MSDTGDAPVDPVTSAMAGDDQTINEDELRELASQLRKPEGAAGLETATMMNETNLTMTLAAFESLGVEPNNAILEIGFGNGGHVAQLLSKNPGVRYTGLDISESMVAEATHRNQGLVDTGTALFHLGDGIQVPFADSSFERVFTVNTIYFWEDQQGYLAEIGRVTAPGGSIAIVYITPEFFDVLPFTKYGFTRPDDADLRKLANSAGLTVDNFDHQSDEVVRKDGTAATRSFTVARLSKR